MPGRRRKSAASRMRLHEFATSEHIALALGMDLKIKRWDVVKELGAVFGSIQGPKKDYRRSLARHQEGD